MEPFSAEGRCGGEDEARASVECAQETIWRWVPSFRERRHRGVDLGFWRVYYICGNGRPTIVWVEQMMRVPLKVQNLPAPSLPDGHSSTLLLYTISGPACGSVPKAGGPSEMEICEVSGPTEHGYCRICFMPGIGSTVQCSAELWDRPCWDPVPVEKRASSVDRPWSWSCGCKIL